MIKIVALSYFYHMLFENEWNKMDSHRKTCANTNTIFMLFLFPKSHLIWRWFHHSIFVVLCRKPTKYVYLSLTPFIGNIKLFYSQWEREKNSTHDWRFFLNFNSTSYHFVDDYRRHITTDAIVIKVISYFFSLGKNYFEFWRAQKLECCVGCGEQFGVGRWGAVWFDVGAWPVFIYVYNVCETRLSCLDHIIIVILII